MISSANYHQITLVLLSKTIVLCCTKKLLQKLQRNRFTSVDQVKMTALKILSTVFKTSKYLQRNKNKTQRTFKTYWMRRKNLKNNQRKKRKRKLFLKRNL